MYLKTKLFGQEIRKVTQQYKMVFYWSDFQFSKCSQQCTLWMLPWLCQGTSLHRYIHVGCIQNWKCVLIKKNCDIFILCLNSAFKKYIYKKKISNNQVKKTCLLTLDGSMQDRCDQTETVTDQANGKSLAQHHEFRQNESHSADVNRANMGTLYFNVSLQRCLRK